MCIRLRLMTLGIRPSSTALFLLSCPLGPRLHFRIICCFPARPHKQVLNMFAQPHFFQQWRAGCVHVFWGVRVTPSAPHTVIYSNSIHRPLDGTARGGPRRGAAGASLRSPRSPQRQEWGFASARREPLNDSPASDVPAAFRWRDAAAVAAL